MATIGYQYIACDPTKCMGCRMCEYACSITKTNEFNPALSRIRVVRIEPITMTAVSCRLCEDAPCIIACPRKALSRAEQNGVILVDNDKCDGCGWCVEACDFGAVVLNPTNKRAEICNLCMDQAGGPRCVQFCPKEALSLCTLEVLRQQARREVVARLLEELSA
jgi:anaerobic carbon-monoxide dehydrogenase iron sulfur subunit